MATRQDIIDYLIQRRYPKDRHGKRSLNATHYGQCLAALSLTQLELLYKDAYEYEAKVLAERKKT